MLASSSAIQNTKLQKAILGWMIQEEGMASVLALKSG